MFAGKFSRLNDLYVWSLFSLDWRTHSHLHTHPSVQFRFKLIYFLNFFFLCILFHRWHSRLVPVRPTSFYRVLLPVAKSRPVHSLRFHDSRSFFSHVSLFSSRHTTYIFFVVSSSVRSITSSDFLSTKNLITHTRVWRARACMHFIDRAGILFG